jgi:SAM-dependent methyltransferase
MSGPITPRQNDQEHASRDFMKDQATLSRRLSQHRDEQLARKALSRAGDPGLILDLPCGNGRFWPMLGEKPNRVIIAAGNSAASIEAASALQPAELAARIRPLQTSAFAIDLPDNAVDSIFSMRMLHRVGDAAQRLKMLKEFHRVTRETLIVSLWIDGNFKSWKRKRLEQRRHLLGPQRDEHHRFVIPRATVEDEFRQAGFRVQERLDAFPLYALWRVYVLCKA